MMLLKKIKAHELWLDTDFEQGERLSLHNFDFQQANLLGMGITLRDVDWRYSDLRGANLNGANLNGADLRGADLDGAVLIGAVLRGADLIGADLRGADLRGAVLIGADLRWANLNGADLRGADLDGAVLRGADLIGADLRWANLNEADLREADLDGAVLRGADLIGADLRGVKGLFYTAFDPRGWVLVSWRRNGVVGFTAGCQSFPNADKARSHWGSKNYRNKERGQMYLDCIDFHLKQWDQVSIR